MLIKASRMGCRPLNSAIAALSMDKTPNKELIAMMFAFENENDVQELVHKLLELMERDF